MKGLRFHPLGWFMDHAQVTSVRLESEADDESFWLGCRIMPFVRIHRADFWENIRGVVLVQKKLLFANQVSKNDFP